jgi:hypothetical protein
MTQELVESWLGWDFEWYGWVKSPCTTDQKGRFAAKIQDDEHLAVYYVDITTSDIAMERFGEKALFTEGWHQARELFYNTIWDRNPLGSLMKWSQQDGS